MDPQPQDKIFQILLLINVFLEKLMLILPFEMIVKSNATGNTQHV